MHEEMIMGVFTPGGPKLLPSVEGLYLEPDTSPYTGTTLNSGWDALFNGEWNETADEWWLSQYAYGIDLASPKLVSRITVGLIVSTGAAGGWWAGYEGNQMDVYKSDDNANWTLVGVFDAPDTSDHDEALCKVVLDFGGNHTARYFKVVNSDPQQLTSAFGYAYGISEMQLYKP